LSIRIISMGITIKNILRGVIILGILGAALFILEGRDKIPPPSPPIGANQESEIKSVKFKNAEIRVDLALTALEQERGLSGREKLGEKEGLLFVFPVSGKYYFWMKDMKFPIDILWLNSEREVIYIKANALPSSYPDIFAPESDAKYVLEVNAGFAKNNNVLIGDRAEFGY